MTEWRRENKNKRERKKMWICSPPSPFTVSTSPLLHSIRHSGRWVVPVPGVVARMHLWALRLAACGLLVTHEGVTIRAQDTSYTGTFTEPAVCVCLCACECMGVPCHQLCGIKAVEPLMVHVCKFEWCVLCYVYVFVCMECRLYMHLTMHNHITHIQDFFSKRYMILS